MSKQKYRANLHIREIMVLYNKLGVLVSYGISAEESHIKDKYFR